LKVKYDEAISMAQKAVKVKPDADNIWDTPGWLYYEKGILKKQ
jgi:hypothetical protein